MVNKGLISGFIFSVFAMVCGYGQTKVNIPTIRVNSLGFLPGATKEATLTDNADSFYVCNAVNRKVVFSGRTTPAVYQKDVNQTVRIADFSVVSKKGTYYLETSGKGRSVVFPINKRVYDDAYRVTMRAFYLWRCGMNVSGTFNGVCYKHGACHLDDGYEDYIGWLGRKRNGVGGWHDAGDYGKYVVNAGVTMGILFMVWEHFGPTINKIRLNLPRTAPGYPEFLEELKWETDWLLKMQYPDGSGRVSHKLTRTNFADFIMADKDEGERYFADWTSAATADFVAVLARAARAFGPYDKAYALKCLNAAVLSYNFLRKNPDNKTYVNPDFKTGGYETDDKDDRLWAAAEMWETTGKRVYLKDFEERAGEMNYKVEADWDFGTVSNLGMFTYLLSGRQGKNATVERAIRANTIKTADAIVNTARKDVYRRPLGGIYYWGCNGTVARQAVNLYVASALAKNRKYTETALDIIGHLLGRNYYGRSYVTDVGVNPPMHPHDRRSASDGIEAPWPGYLVGGGLTATDWVDEQANYSHNEIAINWQAPLVFVLAWFVIR